jgi:hypothetical protein
MKRRTFLKTLLAGAAVGVVPALVTAHSLDEAVEYEEWQKLELLRLEQMQHRTTFVGGFHGSQRIENQQLIHAIMRDLTFYQPEWLVIATKPHTPEYNKRLLWALTERWPLTS